MQKSVNDITDAFVREASASMDYASHGKYFRKIMVRGLPGSFRRSAAVINGGTDSPGKRVMEIGSLSKQFGGQLRERPRSGCDVAARGHAVPPTAHRCGMTRTEN